MSDLPVANAAAPGSLTGLLVPLADRNLLLPNVAVAELITYRAPQPVAGLPSWYLGQVAWRDLRLPLLSFEAASGGQAHVSSGARVIVVNALGGRPNVKFLALLVQGIPSSVKVGSDLKRADVPLDAVDLGDAQARIPDLAALEQKLADSGLI